MILRLLVFTLYLSHIGIATALSKPDTRNAAQLVKQAPDAVAWRREMAWHRLRPSLMFSIMQTPRAIQEFCLASGLGFGANSGGTGTHEMNHFLFLADAIGHYFLLFICVGIPMF